MSPEYVPASSHAPDPALPTQLLRTPLGSLSMIQVGDLTATEALSEWVIIFYRWPSGRPICPRSGCGSKDVRKRRGYKRANQLPVRFVCNTCGREFTVHTGGYFLAKSALPYKTWVWALYIVLSTLEREPPTPASLVRDLGVAEDTASHILSRLRKHLQDIGTGLGGPGPP